MEKKKVNFWVILGLQLGILAVLLAAMQIAVGNGYIDKLYISAPSQIFSDLVSLFNQFFIADHLWTTVYEFMIGFAVSAILGIGLGILIARFHTLDAFTKPFIAGFMALPKVAIVPIILIWLGIGSPCKIAFVFLFSFFSILYNTIAGVKQTPMSYIKVARVFGAKKIQLVTKVMLKSAVPSIFAGLRVAAAGGFAGAIFGEMLASQKGLGNILAKAAGFYNTSRLLAIVVIITTVSVLIIKGINTLEKNLFLRWKLNK